jgi:glycosidase
MRSERVRQEIANILAFWLDQGVSGFRLLSAPYLYEATDVTLNDTLDESRTKNLEETYAYVGELRSILQRYEDEDGEHRVLLVEAENSPIDSVVKYYGSSTEPLADLPVNGQLIKELREGFSSMDLRKTVEDYLSKVRTVAGAWPTWGEYLYILLLNHALK